MSLNWNDYWFQGDLLIRDFEGMYQAFEDPWFQCERAMQPKLPIALALMHWMLRANDPKEVDILDVGAGLGGPTYYLKELGSVLATDISPAAVAKAQAALPDVEFEVDDIRVRKPQWAGKFDAICAFELLYFVATEIDLVLANLHHYLKPNGGMVFTYYFPENAWTKRYIPSRAALIGHLEKFFSITEFVDLNPHDTDRRVFIGLVTKRSDEPTLSEG